MRTDGVVRGLAGGKTFAAFKFVVKNSFLFYLVTVSVFHIIILFGSAVPY